MLEYLLLPVAAYAAAAAGLVRATRLADDVRYHAVTTHDGWSLPVAEYGAPGGPVVFLQHGLAASSRTFDLHPHGPSMARWLADQGFHVFAGNLRGRRGAVRAGRREPWGFGHYLTRDLPPVVEFVTQRAGRPVHWVGHSMGGILGLAYAGHYQGRGVASVTSVGSALHYDVGSSLFQVVYKAKPALGRLPGIPWRAIQRGLTPLGRMGIGQSATCNAENMTGKSIAATMAHVFVDMTRDELLELGTSFEGPGIYCAAIDRLLFDAAAELPVPWLSVIGTGDVQCPPDTFEHTFARVGAPRKELFLAGRAHGHAHDYGHFDLIAGRRAEEEIWPRVAAFVRDAERHDAARRSLAEG